MCVALGKQSGYMKFPEWPFIPWAVQAHVQCDCATSNRHEATIPLQLNPAGAVRLRRQRERRRGTHITLEGLLSGVGPHVLI